MKEVSGLMALRAQRKEDLGGPAGEEQMQLECRVLTAVYESIWTRGSFQRRGSGRSFQRLKVTSDESWRWTWQKVIRRVDAPE